VTESGRCQSADSAAGESRDDAGPVLSPPLLATLVISRPPALSRIHAGGLLRFPTVGSRAANPWRYPFDKPTGTQESSFRVMQ
jgi:hypothetical protein